MSGETRRLLTLFLHHVTPLEIRAMYPRPEAEPPVLQPQELPQSRRKSKS